MKIGCGILAFLLLVLLSGCGEQARHFKIEVDANEDAWVEINIDGVSVLKEGTSESAAKTTELPITVQATGLPAGN